MAETVITTPGICSSNGLDWYYLIINQPQFADKCNWDKLDQDNWTELLLKNPEYADKCDWKKIKYDHLLKKLLRKYPQFTDNFDYSELNASAMVKLCLVQPLVFKHCRLENFSGRDWVDLLKNRPIFAEYCPWEKLYAEDWCLLLAVQPRFAEHFDFRGFLPWHWAGKNAQAQAKLVVEISGKYMYTCVYAFGCQIEAALQRMQKDCSGRQQE